jgi:hypothetical protein
MADDVKVKFGGDFSGVSKGATDAASQAGSALGTAIEGKVKAIGASIAAAFAVGAIASRLWEGFKSGIAYMHELNLAVSRTGQSSGEFQKLAYAGKEAGVSMDIVGRGLTEANKALEQAKVNENQRNMFVALGMDAEQLKAGTYTATDALLALADQWDKFGNETKTRAGAMAVFGRFGEGMIPVIKQGRSAIEEQTASVQAQTRAEILGAAAIEKKIAALERYTKQLERMGAAQAGIMKVGGDFGELRDELRKEKRGNPNKYYEQYGDQTPTEVATAKMQKEYKEKFGINPEEFNIIIREALKNLSPESAIFKEATAVSQRLSDEYLAAKNKGPSRPVEELAGALSASSLQAIGGGDVASVLSGTYQNDMVDLTRQIATNTTPRETAHETPPPARAGR